MGQGRQRGSRLSRDAEREGLKSRPVAVGDVALYDAQHKVGKLALQADIIEAVLGRTQSGVGWISVR